MGLISRVSSRTYRPSKNAMELELIRGETQIYTNRAIISSYDDLLCYNGHILVTNYRFVFHGNIILSENQEKEILNQDSQKTITPESTENLTKIQWPLGHIKSINLLKNASRVAVNDYVSRFNLGPVTRNYAISCYHELKKIEVCLGYQLDKKFEKKFQTAIENGSRPFSTNQEPFAFAYFDTKIKNLNPFNLSKEYTRLLKNANDIWRITSINEDYALSSHLPKKLPVPIEADDAFLEKIQPFRQNGFI